MIRLLDETTVGQIAAGEVVERPISVVKELVENALDAGATRIAVAVCGGGLGSIEVTDDGAGIPRDELRLAFARHATSKLRDALGLTHVATLGFRGEGLASIAAVARVSMISRTQASDFGYAVEAFENAASEPEPTAAPLGTRVVVRELFANVPVRREYLRSPSAEFARISGFLATLALGYPEVTFALEHDGRPTFVFPAARGLEQRLAHVFGGLPARGMLGIASGLRGDAGTVAGYISPPGSDRPDRRLQFLFVNRRLLRTTLMAGAWNAGYAGYALAHRQPYGVLFLEIAPDQVDPNVHPTKSDVRLRNPSAVAAAVRHAIAETLAADAGTRLHASLSFAPPVNAAQQSGTSPSFDFEAPPDGARGGGLRVLAQLDNTFILATDGEALVLVDQHAAHERIAYEAIERRARSGGADEPLLIPYTIELDPPEAGRFETSRAELARAGLEAEPFGERAYRIIATPAGYGARSFDVRGYLDDLTDQPPGLDARQRVWASLACHSVVRAGERLDVAEMSALLARLVQCRNPMHCPHGRPTTVRVEAAEIARMFKR